MFVFILSLIILQVNHTVAEKLEHEFNRIPLNQEENYVIETITPTVIKAERGREKL